MSEDDTIDRLRFLSDYFYESEDGGKNSEALANAANMLETYKHQTPELLCELERLRAQVAELENQKDAAIQQAQIWKQEARTMQNIVAECYQAVTGSAGEPGDWNGANPVRELVQERDRLRDSVKELSSAMLSVNRSRHQKIMIDGDDQPCYWQREEWVKWMVELATEARKGIENG